MRRRRSSEGCPPGAFDQPVGRHDLAEAGGEHVQDRALALPELQHAIGAVDHDRPQQQHAYRGCRGVVSKGLGRSHPQILTILARPLLSLCGVFALEGKGELWGHVFSVDPRAEPVAANRGVSATGSGVGGQCASYSSRIRLGRWPFTRTSY